MSTKINLHRSVLHYLDVFGTLEAIKRSCLFFKTLQDRAFHFVIPIEPSDLLELDATLGNLVLNNPTGANKLFQEVVHAIVESLNLLPNCSSVRQVVVVFKLRSLPKLPGYQIKRSAEFLKHAKFMRFIQYEGIVYGMTTLHKYTKSARFVCPEEQCEGSEGNKFIRVHIPGARETQTIRSDFRCTFCGSALEEDISCRILADKLIVDLIDKDAFSNDGNEHRCQSISTHLRDDLVKGIEIGETLQVIGIPVWDVHKGTLALEANNIQHVRVSRGVSVEAEIPQSIQLLLHDRQESPWSFPLSLAYALGSHLTPAGSFLHLKLGLLLSLAALDSKHGSLDVLAIASDSLLISRLLLHAATLSPRYVCYSPHTALTATAAPDKRHGSADAYIDGGSLLLAHQGVCIIPELDVLKKNELASLFQALEAGHVTVDLRQKSGVGHVMRLPKHCAVWTTSTDTKHKLCTLTDAFGMAYYADVTPDSHVDYMILHHSLQAAMKQQQPVIDEQDIKTYLSLIADRNVKFSECSERLIKGFYVASRRVRAGQDSSIPINACHVITGLAAAHAKLSLHEVVTNYDAAMAILLYEESITSKTGYSVLSVQPIPHVKDNNISAYIGEENDQRMYQFMQHLHQFIANHADLDSSNFPEE